MKKTIFLLLSSAITFHLMAQVPTIKNSSFENWTNVGGYLYPDSMNICDTAAVEIGALTRKTGGTDGLYSLHLGSYNNQGNIVGTYIEISDTLTKSVGGIAFDCRIQNNNTQWLNGLFMTIYFYDSLYNYIIDESWSSPQFTNYNNFTAKSWSFNSPAQARYYLLEIDYFNAYGASNEYAEVDKLRFLEASYSIPEQEIFTSPYYYPNPANNYLTIKAPQKATIEISNIEGQLIRTIAANENKTTIDISGFAKGMYFVKVKTEKGIAVKKFIKE